LFKDWAGSDNVLMDSNYWCQARRPWN